jgi:hypothetical protein
MTPLRHVDTVFKIVYSIHGCLGDRIGSRLARDFSVLLLFNQSKLMIEYEE